MEPEAGPPEPAAQPAQASKPLVAAQATNPAQVAVGQLIQLETAELVALAKDHPSKRREVLNVLWGRGERAKARAIAAIDSTLTPKLAALEARDRRQRLPEKP